MIKVVTFIVFWFIGISTQNAWALSNLFAYPVGPFKSEYKLDQAVLNKQIRNQDNYKFTVPDLGRFQDRKPNESLSSFGDIPGDEKQQNMQDYQSQTLANDSQFSSFDDLPTDNFNAVDEGEFYPPEWAQPNPLRPLQLPQYQVGVQRSQPSQQYNQNNSSFMGMPMPAQMMPWQSN